MEKTRPFIDKSTRKSKRGCVNCLHFEVTGIATGKCALLGKYKSKWAYCQQIALKPEASLG